jgi:spore coat polysaccharide biosynthesis protein SpsF
MFTIRIVLQARMGSARRPGKTVADVAGRTLLERCLERLSAARALGAACVQEARWELIVATSTLTADDPIARIAASYGVGCVRGSENDVLARFLLATHDLDETDVVVRATADNPLYCPDLTVRLVEHHLDSKCDYTGIAEALSPTVPDVLRVGALRGIARAVDLDDYCREHVTPYLRQSRSTLDVELLPPRWCELDPSLRLTVDTPDDLARMNALYETLLALTGGGHPSFWTLEQIYSAARALVAGPAAMPNVAYSHADPSRLKLAA